MESRMCWKSCASMIKKMCLKRRRIHWDEFYGVQKTHSTRLLFHESNYHNLLYTFAQLCKWLCNQKAIAPHCLLTKKKREIVYNLLRFSLHFVCCQQNGLFCKNSASSIQDTVFCFRVNSRFRIQSLYKAVKISCIAQSLWIQLSGFKYFFQCQ